jgi:hypothetical protein
MKQIWKQILEELIELIFDVSIRFVLLYIFLYIALKIIFWSLGPIFLGYVFSAKLVLGIEMILLLIFFIIRTIKSL